MIPVSLKVQILADLAHWESFKPWMYLDSEGFVTVGYGTMLPDAESAVALPFFHEKSEKIASDDEKRAAWAAVHTGSHAQKLEVPKKKFGANHYKATTTLRLVKSAADAARDRHLENDFANLMHIYTGFDSFPDKAKLALFDMIYNIGAGREKNKYHKASGMRKYSSMNAAIANKDWIAAGDHCHRIQVSYERNQATKNLFYDCVEKKKGD